MNTLVEIRDNLVALKTEIARIKSGFLFRKFVNATIKAGFREEQRRDELGRWTAENGVEVSTSPGFLTGIPTIDETSQALSDSLVRVMGLLEYLPTMSPQAYGIAVHAAFGLDVRLQNLPGVGNIERSFSLDEIDPLYGMAGSIRTDVVLRDIQGDIIAIYDVKTGDARISRSRADELRSATRANPNTPVFELNVVRGISRKSLNRQQSDAVHQTWFQQSISRRF